MSSSEPATTPSTSARGRILAGIFRGRHVRGRAGGWEPCPAAPARQGRRSAAARPPRRSWPTAVAMATPLPTPTRCRRRCANAGAAHRDRHPADGHADPANPDSDAGPADGDAAAADRDAHPGADADTDAPAFLRLRPRADRIGTHRPPGAGARRHGTTHDQPPPAARQPPTPRLPPPRRRRRLPALRRHRPCRPNSRSIPGRPGHDLPVAGRAPARHPPRRHRQRPDDRRRPLARVPDRQRHDWLGSARRMPAPVRSAGLGGIRWRAARQSSLRISQLRYLLWSGQRAKAGLLDHAD